MNNAEPVCPKCRATMEEGFIVDSGHYNSEMVSTWMEGQPDERWWGLKTGSKEKLKVSTYRCTACGYLESYALPAQD